MQVILNSNKQSYVEAVLTSSGTQSLVYATRPSYPNVSKANHMLQPYNSFNNAPDGNTHTFNLTKGSGIHYLGRIKYEGTVAFASAAAVTGFNIMNIIESVIWKSNGQPILTLTGEALKALTMNSPAAMQEHIWRYSRALSPGTEQPIIATFAAGPIVSYLPIFASWYGSIEKALNLNVLEQIEVTIKYKSAAQSGLATGFTQLKATFENFTYLPDPVTYSKMVSSDFDKASLTMQCFNTYTERFQASANASGNTYRVTSEIVYPVYKTHIMVVDLKPATLNAPLVNFDSVSITVGGEYIYSNYSKSMINYEQAWRGNSSHSLSVPATVVGDSNLTLSEAQCYTIDWSLGCNRENSTGLAAMSQLNKPVYELNFTAGIPADSDTKWVILVHEYWNIVQVQPGTRALTIVAAM